MEKSGFFIGFDGFAAGEAAKGVRRGRFLIAKDRGAEQVLATIALARGPWIQLGWCFWMVGTWPLVAF